MTHPSRVSPPVTVLRWTGREARALREAMRLPVRAFAEIIGVTDRMVSKWEAGGAKIAPRPEMQAALDTILEQAVSGVRQRFTDALPPPAPSAAREPSATGNAASGLTPQFAAVLRCLRNRHGLTLKALGERVFASESHLCGVEIGRRVPSEDIALSLDDYFQASGLLVELRGAELEGRNPIERANLVMKLTSDAHATPTAAIADGKQLESAGLKDRPEPNDLFRRARERLRTPSGTIPTRREIADMVNVFLADNHPAEPFIDRTYTRKVEAGIIRWPHPNRRAAFRHILGVRTDAEIGFRPGAPDKPDNADEVSAPREETLISDGAEIPPHSNAAEKEHIAAMDRTTVPNDKLRRSRRGKSSPSGSGRPMSRQELADACNQIIARRFSVDTGGRWVGMTAAYVGALERGEIRWPNTQYRHALCAVLDETERDLGLYIIREDQNEPSTDKDASSTTVVEGITREATAILAKDEQTIIAEALTSSLNSRGLLHDVLIQSEPLPSGALMATVAQIRRTIDRTLAARGTVMREQVDNLLEAVSVNARECVSAAPLEMLCRLTLDMADVEEHLAVYQPSPIAQDLHKVAAQLATLIADEMMVLGDVHQSRAWHHTARIAADKTNDVSLQADVRTLAALLPLYYGDPSEAISLSRQAQQIAGKTPSLTQALAPVYESLALAQLSVTVESEVALARGREQAAELNPEYRIDSVFGFSERRFRFYEGKILSYLGRTDEAWEIHDDALALYPEDVVGDRALIQFDRSISLIRGSQTAAGCALAAQTLLGLPGEHRTDIFIRAARRAISVVPRDDYSVPEVQHLRETLRLATTGS